MRFINRIIRIQEQFQAVVRASDFEGMHDFNNYFKDCINQYKITTCDKGFLVDLFHKLNTYMDNKPQGFETLDEMLAIDAALDKIDMVCIKLKKLHKTTKCHCGE